MNSILRSTLITASIAALTVGASGCKRVDNTSRDTMSSGSSGVMSNSAAPSVTGNSDAAKRVTPPVGTAPARPASQ